MAKDDYYIGIDLGGTNITVGMVDEKYEVVARDKTKTKAAEGLEVVLDRLVKLTEDVIEGSGVSRKRIKGLGIGAPGAIDTDKGVVIKAVNLGWDHIELADILEKRLGLKTVLDNDVNVGTWAEARVGSARECKDVLGIFVGTGVGGGLIINGKLHGGFFDTAGEIGHIVIDRSGGPGKRTVEDLASRTSVVKQICHEIESGRGSVLEELYRKNPTEIRSKKLSKAFAAEDEVTHEVIRKAAEVIGIAAATVVTLVGMEAVVIGGGLTEALDSRWMQWVTESFNEHVFPPTCRDCKILRSMLEDDAGLIGAALLAEDAVG